MASNFWSSSQRSDWQFDRDTLLETRDALENENRSLILAYPLPDLRHLSIFFNQRRQPILFVWSEYLC